MIYSSDTIEYNDEIKHRYRRKFLLPANLHLPDRMDQGAGRAGGFTAEQPLAAILLAEHVFPSNRKRRRYDTRPADRERHAPDSAA